MTKNFTSKFQAEDLILRIGDKLNGKRNSKGGFDLCRCPAHKNDNGGNLSVDLGHNGDIVLHCYAGCDFERVRDALRGMNLWPEYAQGREMNPAERARAKKEREAAKAAREAEQAARHQDAAAKAKALYEAANIGADATAHPYNQERGGRWTGHTARRGNWPFHGGDADALLLPYTDAAGELRTLQAISGSGRPFSHGDKKDYYPGGAKRGNFYTFFELGEHVRRFFIGEGFFTVQAAQEAFYQTHGEPPATAPDGWITAGDAGNLEPVARAIHAAHPAAKIIILADEDGPGIIAANKAALAAGGKVARPSAGLPTGADIAKGYDFDDLLNEAGAGAVCAALDKAAKPEGGTVKDAGEAAYQEQSREIPFEERRAAYMARFGRAQTIAYDEYLAERAKQTRTPTGIEGLDALLEGGLEPGLTTLQAMPSAGKTSLTAQIAANIATGGRDVLFFSLEMPWHKIHAKILSRTTWERSERNPRQALTIRQVSDPEYQAVFDSEQQAVFRNARQQYEETAGRRLLVIQAGDKRTSTDEIGRAINDHIDYTGNRPVVFIDYLQQLHPPLDKGTDKQNADANLAALTALCRKHIVPIFAITSMNRQGYTAPNSYTASKESGNIEFSADVMLALFFADAKGQPIDKRESALDVVEGAKCYRVALEVIKNREGQTDPIKRGLLFFAAYSAFEANDAKPSEPKIDPPEVKAAFLDELEYLLTEPHRAKGLSKRQIIRSGGDNRHKQARNHLLEKTKIQPGGIEAAINEGIIEGRFYIEKGKGKGHSRPEILRATCTREEPEPPQEEGNEGGEQGELFG